MPLSFAIITWRPGINDPDVPGWLCTIAYFLTAFLCAWAGWARQKGEEKSHNFAVIWRWLAVCLILLGINKQLDLQTFLIQAGRDAAVTEGWYQKRRRVEAWFTVFFAFALVMMTVFLFWKGGAFIRKNNGAFAGVMVLLVFLIVRAGTIDHVAEHFNVEAQDHKWGWVMELIGCGCISVSAWRAIREHPDSESGPSP